MGASEKTLKMVKMANSLSENYRIFGDENKFRFVKEKGNTAADI